MQPEEQYSSEASAESQSNSGIVHSRVSELLDGVTEIPEEPTPKVIAADPATVAGQDEPDGGDADSSVVDIDSVADPLDDVPGVDADADDLADNDLTDNDLVSILEDDAPGDSEASDAAGSKSDIIVMGEGDDDIAPSSVRIRGRPGGILVEIDEDVEWPEVLVMLEDRLAAAESFFRGGRAVIELGVRDVYESELRKTRELLSRHDMTLAVVRSTSDLTLQSSLMLGLSTSNETAKPVEPEREMAPVVPITQPTSPYFVHNGTLRSGQTLRKSESVVVVGDVNPGAKVISSGDVMIWGRLRGIAYAGAGGDEKALVAAIEFTPTQLRIAALTAVAPDPPKKRKGLRFWKKEPVRRPEVAHISEGRIVVEPWDDTRPGRPKLGRRK